MALTNQTLRQYVGDMASFERHVHNTAATFLQMPRPESATETPVITMVKHIMQVTDSHVTTLERHLGSLGGDAGSAFKKAFAAMSGAVEGLYSRVRGYEESKILRDLYTLLNMGAISYSMLYTTGLSLKSSDTADIAVRHLHEFTPIIMRITETMPGVLVKELSRDYPWIDTDVAEEARRRTLEAWTVTAGEMAR